MALSCDILQQQDRYAAQWVDENEAIFVANDCCRMLCCCCWRPYHCALALSVIDSTIVGILAYRTADLLYGAGNNSNWIDFGVFFILLSFFICELLSMITLAISFRLNNSRYVMPRLTLLTGQLAVTTSIIVILILYFMGFTAKLNDVVIGTYEYWSNDKISDDDHIRVVNDLFVYAIGTFVFLFIYTAYELFEVYITRKYQNTLDTPAQFLPVRNQEPPRLAGPKLSFNQPPRHVAPPPYNPQYH